MERVRVVVFGCLLALGLLCCPSAAYASDGFVGGLQDLVGIREVREIEPERQYIDSYEPGLREVETVEYEEGSVNGAISGVVDAWQSIPFWNTTVSPLEWAQLVLAGRFGLNIATEWMAIAAGFVFVWWGLRKTIRMVMNSFRKGGIKA